MYSKILQSILWLLLTIPIFSQSRWTEVYFEENNAYGDYFIEDYDHGYLLIGRHEATIPSYSWLLKTNINGEIIWKKSFGSDDSFLVFSQIALNNQGSVYIAGGTTHLDENNDPFILKLDSCREKEWCKIINIPGSNNYSTSVVSTISNGCAVLLFSGQNIVEDRICLARFSDNGEMLWKNCYNSPDTSLASPFCRYLMQTNDKGFLINGYCYYADPNNPSLGWLKPYYIKVDSLGQFEWETVVHKDVGGENGGTAWSTSINPSGTYYYSSISHFYSGSKSPALLKLDIDGNIVDIYDIITGYSYGGLVYATFINDTALACGVGWGNTQDDIKNFSAIIDTTGKIIDSTFLVQDIYTTHMDTVYDKKLVYMYNTYRNDQFDVHLTKLNYELESDTFYNYPFKYDSLCPYPIANDTITQTGCDIIVGIGEEDIEDKEDRSIMELFPNPATNEINIRFSILDFRSSVFIYDMWGRKMSEINIPKGQQETQIDVSAFPPGVYIAVLKSDHEILDRRKFVVQDQ